MKKIVIPFLGVFILMQACKNDEDVSNAFGNFESVSVMVASEGQGKIISLSLEEGQKLDLNEVMGSIDTTQLHLKKKQLLASIRTVETKSFTLESQIRSMEIQQEIMTKELNRINSLLKDGAATEKQRDDLAGNIDVLKSQARTLESQKQTITAERNTLRIQIDQVEDQINRSKILNPLKGTVLQKYKKKGEIVGAGQAIYKIANLDTLILRCYVSGNQLSQIKLGQEVTVRIDGKNGLEELNGIVTWISSQAEFTPKIIQTREERVNLVYAMKVEVKNDGRLKIGMPGEIKF